MLQLVTVQGHQPEPAAETMTRARRELAFAAAGASEHGITTTMEQALAEGFGRD